VSCLGQVLDQSLSIIVPMPKKLPPKTEPKPSR